MWACTGMAQGINPVTSFPAVVLDGGRNDHLCHWFSECHLGGHRAGCTDGLSLRAVFCMCSQGASLHAVDVIYLKRFNVYHGTEAVLHIGTCCVDI